MTTADDLFGFSDGGAARKSPRRRAPSSLPRRNVPVVTGGLFDLADTVSPERYSAVFHSGASAYYDALGFIRLGKDVGVVATLIRGSFEILTEYLAQGGKVFVDSGAFGQFQKFKAGQSDSPVVDFQEVFAMYERLMAAGPTEHRRNLYVVAPDVLADSDLSLQLLELHRKRVVQLIGGGLTVIVPIQQGHGTANETVARVKTLLGTNDFTVGIPSATAALRIEDIATIRGHNRFHVLGRGAMGLPLFQRTYAFLEHNPGAAVSCDANQIISHTPWISAEQARLTDERMNDVWQVGEFDFTELMYDVANTNDWLTDAQIRRLAAKFGASDFRTVRIWIQAHRHGEGALAPLLDEVDPEGALLAYAVVDIFSVPARKSVSAKMRADAVANVFRAKDAAA